MKGTEELKGFKKKLEEMGISNIEGILELFPTSIVMPLYYKGDVVKVDGEVVTITDNRWKYGSYVYYFEDKDGEIYYTQEGDITI
jgi:hypothetical protein